VITTNHTAFDYAAIADGSPRVVDTRNALKGHTGRHIFRL
jgi:UDP-N-acetyl-D-mannosaminuronate dehydrogenase